MKAFKYMIMALALQVVASFSFAETVFKITDASRHYSAEVTANCIENQCQGPATIRLYKKSNGKLFQTLQTDDLALYLEKGQLPTNNTELYGMQSALIFEDFNFDSHEDLAVRNGNFSSYGGPSYDVYVYNVTKKQFVPSRELTALAVGNLGFFHVDSKRKRLVTFNKSGCCWHVTREYIVIPKKGLVRVFEFEEDAVSAPDEVRLTTRELVNGQWLEKTEIKKTDEYYGQ